MHSSSHATSSLFEYAVADRGGKKTWLFLSQMDKLVPWKEIGDELAPALYDGHLGRPGFPVHVLVKALFLESWFNLSDPELEEQVLDRLSFQRFLGVKDMDGIPDETTICRFRAKMVELDAMKELFEVVAGIIADHGVSVKAGTIVDATIIEAPRGRKREDKTSTRDTDASFTKKNGRTFHGYKLHAATDVDGHFVKKLVVTGAKVHDNQTFDVLVSGETTAVFADKAYVSNEKKRAYRLRGIYWGVLDRANRRRSLSHGQDHRNRQKSSVRCHVEHIFGWMKQTMGFRRIRYRSLQKNTAHFTLIAAAYNLKRLLSVLTRAPA